MKYILRAILFSVIAGFLQYMPANASIVTKVYERPSWWTGSSQCWADYYNNNNGNNPDAVLFTQWRGIQVCGPRPQENNGDDVPELIPNVNGSGNYQAYMFQCTELATRYLRVAYGLNGIQNNGGRNFASAYAQAYPKVLQHFDNGDQTLLQEGDVVSFTSSDPNGHVAIVSAVSVTSLGNATVTFINQNGNPNEAIPGVFQTTISNYVIQDSNGFHPTDWVHPWWSNASPQATVYDALFGVAVVNENTVWTVGNEQLAGKTRQPVTFKLDVTTGTWTKTLPPTQNINRHHDMKAITTTPSGEVFIAGDWNNFGQNLTLIYRWNQASQSWVKVTSANTATNSNYLNGLASDSANNVYAVGSGNFAPLIEKWNGTQFINMNAPTTYGGILESVSFSSPTNGWAVGSNGSQSTLIYFFNGTSWAAAVLPNMHLSDVVAVDNSEAWAIGNTGNQPLVMHYTTATGWQPYTSFNQYPTNTTLRAIGANGPNDVWIVGQWGLYNNLYTAPFTMNYDGTEWKEIVTVPPTKNTNLVSVAVTSQSTWTVGFELIPNNTILRVPYVLNH
jgi:hypothetical protein